MLIRPPLTLVGPFIRYVPYDDGREVIIRRGEPVNVTNGFEVSRRACELETGAVTLIRYATLLSPPAHNPKLRPLSAEALAEYKPEREVLRLHDATISIPRLPKGFNEPEVLEIVGMLVPLLTRKSAHPQSSSE